MKLTILYIIIGIISTILLIYFIHNLYKNSIDRYDKFDDPKLDELRNRISSVIPEIKNVKLFGSNKSFTINKKEIFLCLKDKNGTYYDNNMLTYVLLHELAHVLCDEIGHTDKFRQIFRNLLKRAENGGIYNSSKPPLDNYCS